MKLSHTNVIKALACWKVPPAHPLQNYRKQHSKANHQGSVYSGAKVTVFRHMHYTVYCSNLMVSVQAGLALLRFEDYCIFSQMEGSWQPRVGEVYQPHLQQHLLALCFCVTF